MIWPRLHGLIDRFDWQVSDLIDRLAEAQKELDTVMTLLKEKQDQLAEVEAKIAELQATYDNSVREKQKLERNIATTAARLKRAAKLTTALGDEQIRWAETVKVSLFWGRLQTIHGDLFFNYDW